jgi:hypothetical protein
MKMRVGKGGSREGGEYGGVGVGKGGSMGVWEGGSREGGKCVGDKTPIPPYPHTPTLPHPHTPTL